MDWTQILAIIIGNAGVFLPIFFWLRTEANADRREAAADRRDILSLIREIKDEMKDFHARLYALEERYRSK